MLVNFKKMTDEELRDFWSKYHRAGWQKSVKLFGRKLHKPVLALNALANYAINLATWRSCKAKGDKHGMGVYEHSCRLCFDNAHEAGVDITNIQWQV